MNNNYQENGIIMDVSADVDNIGSCVRSFANKYDADVQIVSQNDQFGLTAFADDKAAWVLFGQAGILGGMRYPMHGRYTNWRIMVVVLNGRSRGQCEVAMNAVGDPNPFHNLSLRCSMEYRKKLKDMLNEEFMCGPSEQINYAV